MEHNKDIIADLTPDRISRVYSGRKGCMCGCKGRYWAASAHRESVGERRGYSLEDHEVSDRQVKRVLNILKSHAGECEVDTEYVAHVYLDLGGRVYCAYLV